MKKAPVKNTAFRKLGLDAGATTQQIRQAFRVLAKKYHPDRNNHTSQSAEKFKDLSRIYLGLSEQELKTLVATKEFTEVQGYEKETEAPQRY